MAQIFRPSADTVIRLALAALVVGPLAGVGLAMGNARSEYVTGRDRIAIHPVPFSHAHHTAEIGIDCRYCHPAVEASARAGMPATSTCMTCHSQLWNDAGMLEPVRRSFATGARLTWRRSTGCPAMSIPITRSTLPRASPARPATGGRDAADPAGRAADEGMVPRLPPRSRPRLSAPRHIFAAFPHQPEAGAAAIQGYLARYGTSAQGLTDCSVCHR